MTPKETVLEHGGSFDGVKSKAHFYLPVEVLDSTRMLTDFTKALMSIGSDFDFVRREKGWGLCRFVGRRKPYKTVWVNCREVPHNVWPVIRLQIHPDGIIEMFEKGRRQGYTVNVGTVYARAMLNEALRKAAAKAKAKKDKKKLRRPRQ